MVILALIYLSGMHIRKLAKKFQMLDVRHIQR